MAWDDEAEFQKDREKGETRDLLALVRKQALYTMRMTHVPMPSEEEIERLADAPTSVKYPGEPRLHDFLHPTVRKVVVNLKAFLEDKPVVHRLDEGEL